MECEKITELLSAKLDGELTKEENQILQAHLAKCPACRALWEDLKALHLDFDTLEELEAPADLVPNTMEKIYTAEQKPKVVPLFRRPQFKAIAGLAACAVLCIGLWQGGFLTREEELADGAPQTMLAAEKPDSDPEQFAVRRTMDLPLEGEKVTLEEDYGRLSLTIPEGWAYETVRNEDSFGISFGPEGEQGKITLTCSKHPVGVCGTGLETETVELDLDRVVEVSTYDHHDLWDFIDLGEEPGTIMAWTQEGVDRWWDAQGDTAMTILRSADMVKR